MARKKENAADDVLSRLEASVDPEKELTAIASRKKPEDASDAPKEKKTTRREVMKKIAVDRESREQRIADEQVGLSTESSLRSAIHEGTIFDGVAAAVEVMENGDGREEVALVVLLQRTIKVVIPFNEMFTYNPIDMSTVNVNTPEGQRDYIRRKRAFAEKMIGAKIEFSLLNIFPDGPVMTAIGSRAAAMRRISARMFGGRNPRFKEGDVGDATVTAVSRHAIAVVFNGVDVVIPQYRLSLRWMRYVGEYYHIGDAVRVKIRQVKMSDEGYVESLTLDPIACELADARERYSLLKQGARVKGIVTNVYRPVGTKNIYIYAWLPDWEFPARILRINANDFGREIKAGTSLRLQVAGHDENGYVSCIALSEHGNSSMFAGAKNR